MQHLVSLCVEQKFNMLSTWVFFISFLEEKKRSFKFERCNSIFQLKLELTQEKNGCLSQFACAETDKTIEMAASISYARAKTLTFKQKEVSVFVSGAHEKKAYYIQKFLIVSILNHDRPINSLWIDDKKNTIFHWICQTVRIMVSNKKTWAIDNAICAAKKNSFKSR